MFKIKEMFLIDQFLYILCMFDKVMSNITEFAGTSDEQQQKHGLILTYHNVPKFWDRQA